MFIIILYASIFIGIVYGIFKLFYLISNSLLLIDETFINYVKNFNDDTIRKLINENDFEKEDNSKVDNHKRLNRHLRLDFIISLFFGIIWFLFPSIVMDLDTTSNLIERSKYVGKTLGLLTLISSLWSLFVINKKEFEKKKKILIGKVFCTLLVILSFLLIISITKKPTIGHVISVIMSSFWLANGYYGVKI